ncbi:DnaJ domain-containing protein [Patescibacteria group bacterium]|nr:DnaJ domain-containing protein [Patescibacteria group bacterium]
MSETKNYYNILGLSKGASQDEIKRAYKKLAKEYHPDVVAEADKATAEKRFKEINEAYQVLSDPQKKEMYDRFGNTNGFAGGFSGAGTGGNAGKQGFYQNGPFTYSYSSSGENPFGNFDPFEVFEDFFGFRGFSQNRAPQKGKNLAYEMRIDFADAVHGAEKEINVESGRVKVKIPQGVRSGTEMKFAGKGMPGPNGLPPGDLYITFRVQTPPYFERSGDNLGTLVEIDFAQAALGDEVEIPVVDEGSKSGIGKAKLKIPQGTQHGTQIRVRGKGMPKLGGSGKGDLIVEVRVKIPQRLSREQRRVLEEYRRL